VKLGGKIENSSVDPMQKESTHLDFSVKSYSRSKSLVNSFFKIKLKKKENPRVGPRRRHKSPGCHLPFHFKQRRERGPRGRRLFGDGRR
jgi:hypothetical protein